MSMIYSFLGTKEGDEFKADEFRHNVLIERGDIK